jgi:hypothetical protein
MKSTDTDLPIQEMSQEERNALREADYESNVSWYDWKGREDNRFLKAVIKHKKDNYYNIQVGYHVNTGWWTLRWANEGIGNVNPPDWVRDIVQPYTEHTQ